MSKRKHDNDDPFLSTMTFTDMANCECEECGRVCRLQFRLGNVPIEIGQQEDVESTFQQRSLVKREGGVSIWKIIMPPGANPITEFGNSHRIIFVWKLPEHSIVKSIGNGTIGSAHEKNTRKIVNWKECSAFFKKSNGGKSIGWMNERIDKDKDTENDVVIYAIKATEAAIESCSTANGPIETSVWASSIIQLFQKYLPMETADELESIDLAFLKNLILESDCD